ncbi:MAG: PRTRC system ThiF family protein [Candidatus Competibacteraceae bacterium]|nr:PRTRC system ThiF family protein [Candidatus Competibacteraceae bacterium]MCB1806269.1 PRTRC system ThiF family protein [Candidatus Competibacteraceae bacterium]MCB1814976.1 PRTRC system ThiF family protein [Candidatus Competibacteraceae bacterium]
MCKLWLPEPWLGCPVRTLLIGAGGTGSHLFGALMALDHALRSLNHPGGLHVTVFDPDKVSSHNIGRQAFWPADVGQNKALTLVQRANLAMGLDWVAEPARFRMDRRLLAEFDLIISAVDRARLRAEIGQGSDRYSYTHSQPILWLDTGNAESQAQLILGHWRAGRAVEWIPNVYQLFPELAAMEDRANRAPPCSAVESLSRQWLPINRIVADTAQSLLWMLFRQGKVDIHGAIIDLQSLSIQPLRCDPLVWASFGWQTER